MVEEQSQFPRCDCECVRYGVECVIQVVAVAAAAPCWDLLLSTRYKFYTHFQL